ncbi:hypothetical protein CBP20_10025 [Fischerella thermalis WC213]|nr:hypothetical protein CBP20_10025 [Fischerella thermalis WC213]
MFFYMPDVREEVDNYEQYVESKLMEWIREHFDIKRSMIRDESSVYYKYVRDEMGREWLVYWDTDDKVSCEFPIQRWVAKNLGFNSFDDFQKQMEYSFIYRLIKLHDNKHLVWNTEDNQVIFFDSVEQARKYIKRKMIDLDPFCNDV